MRNVVVTRTDQAGSVRQSRNVEEHLMVRFPGTYQALAALAMRLLSPRSRLRRAALRRAQVSGYAACSRRDFELAFVRYARDVEVEFEPDLGTLGLGGTYRGHEGFATIIETFGEAWDEWALHPVAMLDMGDQLLGLGYFHLPATASGIELKREFAQLITLKRGLTAHEREFLSWEKGLRAAGLELSDFVLPSLGKAGQAGLPSPARPR